jgi:uncharacterized lipoprotein YmbA
MSVRLILLMLLLTSCSSPEPTYYSLQPVPGQDFAHQIRVIEVRPLGLPGYLDRSEVVLSDASYRLGIKDQARWSEPLAGMMRRVLGQDISSRLPGSTVIAETGGIAARADARVEINIGRFEGDGAGSIRMAAQVKISTEASAAGPRFFAVALAKSVESAAPVATVAALSELLGDLASAVAAKLAQP